MIDDDDDDELILMDLKIVEKMDGRGKLNFLTAKIATSTSSPTPN